MRCKLLFGLLLAASATQGATIGFVFRTDPSGITSDLNGDGSAEASAYLATPTFITFTMNSWPSIQLGTRDGARYFYYNGELTMDGMFLSPVPQTLSCSCAAVDMVGFGFEESFGVGGRGTSIQGPYRVDQLFSLGWGASFSNLMRIGVTPVSGVDPYFNTPYSYWLATLDLFQTLNNLKNNDKVFTFSFQTVWSDPETFTYLRHSNWSGNGRIVDVFHIPTGDDTSAIPEPSAAGLVAGGVLCLLLFRFGKWQAGAER